MRGSSYRAQSIFFTKYLIIPLADCTNLHDKRTDIVNISNFDVSCVDFNWIFFDLNIKGMTKRTYI